MKKTFLELLDELKDEIIREILCVLRIEFSRPMKKNSIHWKKYQK